LKEQITDPSGPKFWGSFGMDTTTLHFCFYLSFPVEWAAFDSATGYTYVVHNVGSVMAVELSYLEVIPLLLTEVR